MPPPKSISVECLITDGDENSLDAARPDLFSLKLYAAITYTKKCIITSDLKIMKFNIFTGPPLIGDLLKRARRKEKKKRGTQ